MKHASFIDQLKLGQKFAVLGVMGVLLAGIPSYLYVSQANKEIGAAVMKTEGLVVIQPLLKLVQLTQQHRGLSAGVLGGNDAMRSQREAKQNEIEQAANALDAIVKQESDAPEIASAWLPVQQRWKSLRSNVAGRSITVEESFQGHTKLIAELMLMGDLLSDHFGLSFDPDAYAYHLASAAVIGGPNFTEDLGQIRGMGAGILAQKSITADTREEMAALVAKAKERQRSLQRTFDKAYTLNPALKEKLAPAMKESAAAVDSMLQLAGDKIVKAEQMTYSSPDYFAACTRAIDAQFKANGIAMEELNSYLDSRVAALTSKNNMLMGSLLLFVLFSGLFGYLSASRLLKQLGGEPGYAAAIVTQIATGDLTVAVETKAGDQSSLLYAMKRMSESLADIVSEVRGTTESITVASRQIAQGNADLSQRTEQQASSLEETASSMEELTSTVRQNADNARQANQLAVNASDIAVKGGSVVGSVVDTMASISDSSNKIADIISVIDSIAFQTNILALNAAVEAARAGEQGRGFAVVANEVRNLAQRSAGAAKEIKSLIDDSVGKVEVGAKQVNQAGATMTEIVQAVKRVTDIMAEIAASSNEQSAGIEQVNQAITQMDEVTQQNAALVEEAAAAAEAMREQAGDLLEAVSTFKLEADRKLSRLTVVKPAVAHHAQASPARQMALPSKAISKLLKAA